MLKFLRKPYPLNLDITHNAKIVFIISLLIGLFLYFFEPFNFNEFSGKQKFIVSSFISIITFSVLSLNLIVLPSYFKKIFNIKKWNILYEILWNIWLAISVGIGYYIYFKITPIFEISIKDAATIILISFLTISILVVLNQNRLVKVNLNDAVELNKLLLAKIEQPENKVIFDSEYKKDSISLNPETIIYLKSAGNYVEIVYIENNISKKHLVRNTLKNFEEKLKKFSYIFKCHRSYIVNVKQIEKALGDSQGLRLVLKNSKTEIPVSRNYVNKLKELFELNP